MNNSILALLVLSIATMGFAYASSGTSSIIFSNAANTQQYNGTANTVTTYFTENGLLTNVAWSATYDNITNSSASSNSLDFSTLPGNYLFNIPNVKLGNVSYFPEPSNGYIFAGNTMQLYFSQNTTSTVSTSASTTSTSTSVTSSLTTTVAAQFFNTVFSENGLPAGATWSATYNGVYSNALSPNTIVFSTVPGNYPFSIPNVTFANLIYTPNQSNGSMIAGNTFDVYFSNRQIAISANSGSSVNTTPLPPYKKYIVKDITNPSTNNFVNVSGQTNVHLSVKRLSISGVTIKFRQGIQGFNISFANSGSPPLDVNPLINAQGYFVINENMQGSNTPVDTYVENVTYNFSIPIDQVRQFGLGAGNVRLFKYENNAWTMLPTVYTSSNSTSYFYSALSNSLSTYAIGFSTSGTTGTTGTTSLALTSGFPTYFYAAGIWSTSTGNTPPGFSVSWTNDSNSSKEVSSGHGNKAVNYLNASAVGHATSEPGTVTISSGATNYTAIAGIGANVIYGNGAVFVSNTLSTTDTLSFSVASSNSFVIIGFGSGSSLFSSAPTTTASGCVVDQSPSLTYAEAAIMTCNSVAANSYTATLSTSGTSPISVAAYVFHPYTVTLDDIPSTGSINLGGTAYTNGQAAQVIGTTTLNAIVPSGDTFNSWSVSNSNASIVSTNSANTFVTIEGNTVITASFSVPLPTCTPGTPSTVPSGITNYSELCIQNGQPSATGVNFQQEVSLYESNATYGPYIAYNGILANFEYFYSNGTIAPAWIEKNSSGTITTWVKLNPSVLASSAFNGLYLGFAPKTTNILSSSGTSGIGEAPNITSSSYALYDDGRKVFPFYDNFAGTTLNSTLWTASSSNYTVSNGLLMEASTSATFNVTSVAQTYNSDMISELYANASEALTGGSIGIAWSLDVRALLPTASYLQARSSWSTPGSMGVTELSGTQSTIWESTGKGSLGMQFYNAYSTPTTAYSSMGNVYPYNSIDAGSSTSDVYYSANGAELQIQDRGTSARWYVQYVRQRAPPPGGVMPTAILGTVTAVAAPSCTITLPITAINFGNVNPKTNINTINSITDDNGGTVSAYMYVYGANMIGGVDQFGVSNTSWSSLSNVAYSSANELSAIAANTLLSVPASGSNTIYFGINLPGGVPAGAYSQTITIENTC